MKPRFSLLASIGALLGSVNIGPFAGVSHQSRRSYTKRMTDKARKRRASRDIWKRAKGSQAVLNAERAKRRAVAS